MKNQWDVKPPKSWGGKSEVKRQRRIIRKFFKNMKSRGGIIDGKAVLFVYVDSAPELSYIISEDV